MKITLVLFLFLSMNSLGQIGVFTWNFMHPLTNQWIEAGTHGSVQEKLIERGELPDPFYGKNEEKFSWIEDHTWEFVTRFNVTSEMLQKEFVEIDFPGIDTYAEIYLNDSLIAFANNAFKPYRFQVKHRLKAGVNVMRVVFYPPVLYHKEMYQKASYHLPAPNDPHPIAIAPYTRKPQYQFGWDWALRMNTVGFVKPVELRYYDGLRITGKNIATASLSEEKALMTFELFLSGDLESELLWESELFGDINFRLEGNVLKGNLEIQDPELWWPRGQGKQHLYEDIWQVKNAQGEILDQLLVRFGIRNSALIMEADQWGTSYEIHVNNRPVFCKGADYIPQHIFPSKVTDEDLYEMVRTMAGSNFNMVRVWGGGYYPDDAFFDACDEFGIMVWQDFMFACAMYPGDPEFLANVKGELDFQIPRIASHPSLVLFNGNNEVDVAWDNWGFQVRYNIYGKDAREVEESYDRLFKQLIPNTIEGYTNSPYIHTSPLSNWGKDEYYDHGSQHYWGVWHGKDPMENFATKIGRFNAEYGFQSFPEFATIATFAPESEWRLDSELMKFHQKSYVGNGMIEKHAKKLFGAPKDFEQFVYFSQLTQASAVSMAVTGHRLDAPRCMGTLYWQLNDCWPAPTWSSIDHYGNWKALQYWIKKDYEDVAVLKKTTETGFHEFYLVSDQIDTFMCELNYTVYDLHGKKLFDSVASQLVRGNESTKICISALEKELKGKNCVIQFYWKNNHGEVKTRTFSVLPSSYAIAKRNDITIEIQSINEEKGTAKLIIKNKKFLHNLWVSSNRLGVRFENNFMDLLPGEHHIEIEFEVLPSVEDFDFQWM